MKKEKKINIGIIGCGYWGPNFIRNFRSLNGVYIKYACDFNPERLKHIHSLYPGIITINDHRAVVKDRQINAVIVATSATQHYELVKEALLNNKHVLVEKPIATKIDEAKELIGIAEKNGNILMVSHTFKFNPAVIKLREIIKSGSLGKIYYIYSRRTNLGPIRKDVNAMWDLAPHDISIINYLLDDTPLYVQAQGEKYLPHNLEDVSFITLTFPKKVLAHIQVSWLDPRKTREMVVVGDKKMAIFDDLNPQAPITIYDKSIMTKKFRQEYDSFQEFQMIIKNGKAQIPKIKLEEPLRIECRHFLDCIRENMTPLTDGRDGLEVLRVLLAIQESLVKKSAKISLK